MSNLLPKLCQIAKAAGDAILAVYQHSTTPSVQLKTDHSPVTAADLAAHHLIVSELQKLTAEIPILSEESQQIAFSERQHWSEYWLVDPLDGTKEFLARNGDFTVNIALVKQHRPVLAVVYAPVTDCYYFAKEKGPAFRQHGSEPAQPIQCRPYLAAQPLVVASRRHGQGERLTQYFANLPQPFQRLSVGSSLKFCLLAAGEADIYPRFGPTSEWDTAAAQCILEAAGGAVIDLTGESLQYNRKESLLNSEFLAVADSTHDWLAYLPPS